MDLDDVIAAVVTVEETISGVTVFSNPPESANTFPSIINLEKTMGNDLQAAPDVFQQEYVIAILVLQKRANLPTAVGALRDYPRLLAAAFAADRSLGGECLMCLFQGGALSTIEWNGTPYLGWECTLRVVDVG